MSNKYQHRRHNKNLLMVHLIFVTKYRKPLLIDEFKIAVRQSIFSICAAHHWYIKRIKTDRDHIHILLQYAPTDSITKIVSTLKQVSTYKMWQIYPHKLKAHYWKKRTLWSDGYFAASVGQVSQETIEKYIANQG